MREEINAWLTQTLSRLNIHCTETNFDDDFFMLGMGSLEFIQLVVYIETQYDIDFDDEYLELGKLHTLNQVVDYIVECIG